MRNPNSAVDKRPAFNTLGKMGKLRQKMPAKRRPREKAGKFVSSSSSHPVYEELKSVRTLLEVLRAVRAQEGASGVVFLMDVTSEDALTFNYQKVIGMA